MKKLPIILLASAAGFFPAQAEAAPPILNSVGQTDRHLTASWTLPTGVEASLIEAAKSPITSTDGYFFSENVELFDTLEDYQTTYVSNSQLDPGTYYVHVGGYDSLCLPCPIREFSQVLTINIPFPEPQPLFLSRSDAVEYINDVLTRKYGRVYVYGYNQKATYCDRFSGKKIRCDVKWIYGDLSFKGTVTIALYRPAEVTQWRYSYRIKRINHYCKALKKKRCTKIRRAYDYYGGRHIES